MYVYYDCFLFLFFWGGVVLVGDGDVVIPVLGGEKMVVGGLVGWLVG